MKKNATYQEQINTENILRLREILKTLPPFAKDYFRAMEPTTSTRTRISYAYDIRIFFHFLLTENPSQILLWMCWINWELWILKNIRNT